MPSKQLFLSSSILDQPTSEWAGTQNFKSLSMEQDVKVRRARFISRSMEVQEQFAFAHPGQVLRAVQIYCSDAYGSPL